MNLAETKVEDIFPPREQCTYTECYCNSIDILDRLESRYLIRCHHPAFHMQLANRRGLNVYSEENVWKLCEHVKTHHPSALPSCYCVFVSNDKKQIPLWGQRASKYPDGLICWDYHVILVYKHGSKTLVYDMDSTMEFPCEFGKYNIYVIRKDSKLRPEFHRKFRVVQAEDFLRRFASDRSHMLDENGAWLKPPPLYPCIHTHESSNNIHDFISMNPNVGFGTVMTTAEFLEYFDQAGGRIGGALEGSADGGLKGVYFFDKK